MARNGSGTYNRAVSPYTAGTTITAAAVNQEMDDIATALTGSMARDGQSPATANISMGGFRITGLANAVASTDAAALGQITAAQAGAVAKAGDTLTGALNFTSGALNFAPWVDLASATTTDIGAQTSNNVRITGTTTITSFGTAASGVTRELRFAGALTLTHNATSLILPFGANIITTAGDTCTARSLGSGNWVVTDFMFANNWRGGPLVLAEAVASASATLDITAGLDNTYDRFELELNDLVPATNDVEACLRIGTGVGPTWQAGALAYFSSILGIAAGSTALIGKNTSFIPLSQAPPGNNGVISAAGYGGLRGLIRFYNPENAVRWFCDIQASHFAGSGAFVSLTGGGFYSAASAITGLRFLFSSGNITSGSIRLLGYRK